MKKKDKIVTRRVKGSNKSKWMKMTQLPQQNNILELDLSSHVLYLSKHTHHTRLYIYLFFNFAFIVFGTFYLLSGQSMSERIMNGVFTIQVLCVCTKHIVQQQKRLLFVWSFRVYGLCVCENWDTTYNSFYSTFFNINISLSHTLATKDAFNNSIYKPFYFDAYP
jgi:hypothetical protein